MRKIVIKNKKIIIGLAIALSLGFFHGVSGVPKDEYNLLLIQKEKIENQTAELDKLIEDGKQDNSKLQAQKYEKDRLIQEEKDRIAKEVQAKKEAERIAKEAQDKKDAERIAAEAASAKIAAKEEADKLAAGKAETITTNGSAVETTVGEMVWLSETGDKYHNKNNCGKMNPSKARQVSIDEARQTHKACTKCFH